MKEMRKVALSVGLLLLISIACSLPANVAGLLGGSSGRIDSITFCTDVTDEGECVDEGSTFPAGTTSVYALFKYNGMKDGTKWSRVWTQNGDTYDETRDEDWDNGTNGWVAYSVDDPDGLTGKYALTILIGKNEVQKAAFEVTESAQHKQTTTDAEGAGFPAFGPITMAEDAAENAFPIGAAKEFVYGLSRVVGVFPYSNMTGDMTYTAEWLRDGQTLVRKDYPWEDSANGMHFTSLADDKPLPAGKYTLNLYLQDELVRTTTFKIIGEPTPQPVTQEQETAPSGNSRPNRPATPAEVVDADAMRYFNMISDANLPILNQVIKDNLAGWTRVRVVDENVCGADAFACFSKESCDKRWGGTVFLPRGEISGQPDAKVTAALTHELTHGMEFYGGMRCTCSVQKEFYAMAAQMDYLYYSGNQDMAFNDYSALWDNNGRFDTGKLWNLIKKIYSECPEY